MTSEPVSPSVSKWLRFSAWLGRVWRAFVAYFNPPEPISVAPISPAPAPPPPPPPGQLRARRRLDTPMVVPAQGYTFNFHVHATLIWNSDGLYQEQLSSAVNSQMPYAIRRLKAMAASYARHHRPHRARELELDLQDALEKEGAWKYHWGGAALTCRPYIWVELEERVKEAVRPYWEEVIKLDCDHDLQMRRARHAERLSKQWTTILTNLMGSPVADGAAEMTEKDLAEVVAKLVAEQRAAADKLEDLMSKKVEEGDTFERSEHFDALKERLERRADRLFEAAGANGHKSEE
jgi:hypothetical protein